MRPLTPRQLDVLNVIRASIAERGYAPSLEEIARSMNLSALATVHKHVSVLQKKGCIRREYMRSRSIELVSVDGNVALRVAQVESLARDCAILHSGFGHGVSTGFCDACRARVAEIVSGSTVSE